MLDSLWLMQEHILAAALQTTANVVADSGLELKPFHMEAAAAAVACRPAKTHHIYGAIENKLDF